MPSKKELTTADALAWIKQAISHGKIFALDAPLSVWGNTSIASPLSIAPTRSRAYSGMEGI